MIQLVYFSKTSSLEFTLVTKVIILKFAKIGEWFCDFD